MKTTALLFSLAALLVASTASAEDYRTQDERDGYSVKFIDDLLAAEGIDSSAPMIRGGFQPVRTLLLRPRTHFLPELQKSVESL